MFYRRLRLFSRTSNLLVTGPTLTARLPAALKHWLPTDVGVSLDGKAPVVLCRLFISPH